MGIHPVSEFHGMMDSPAATNYLLLHGFDSLIHYLGVIPGEVSNK